MAEPRGSRPRRPPPVPGGKRPPPIPGRNAGGAGADATEESTQRTSALGSLVRVEELIELLQGEADALVTETGGEAVLADLYMSLSLLTHYVSGDVTGARALLERALSHPLAPQLRRAHAFSEESAVRFDASSGGLEDADQLSDEFRTQLCRDLAEAWLYRFGDPGKAAELARKGLSIAAEDPRLREVLKLSLAASGDWSELVDILADGSNAAELMVAAQLSADRMGDSGRALELLGRVADLSGSELAWATALALEIDALETGDATVGSLEPLARRRAALDAIGAQVEAHAVGYRLAQAELREGDAGKARELFGELESATDSPWGASLARQARLGAATVAGEWSEVSQLLAAMAENTTSQPVAVASRKRRAQIIDHRLDEDSSAQKAWAELFDAMPTDVEVWAGLERHLLLDKSTELRDFLVRLAGVDESRSVSALRRAAAVEETRLADYSSALEHILRCVELGASDADLHDLLRLLYRAGDTDRIGPVLRTLGESSSEPRTAAALLVAGGAVSLVAGQREAAAACFKEAVAQDPEHLAATVLLATLHRESGEVDGLITALESMAKLANHDGTRFASLCELGEIYRDRRDHSKARKALVAALEIHPTNADLLHTVALLHDANRQWKQAVEYRNRAVDALDGGREAAAILMEIGAIELEHLGGASQALPTFERAFEIDPASIEALHACQDLYRSLKKPDQLIKALRSEVDLAEDSDRLLAIHLELAQLLSGGDDGGALASYQSALNADPNNGQALQGVLDIARRTSSWDAVVTAFSGARETAGHVETLALAHRELGDWKKYADYRQRQVALTSEKTAKATLANELASVFVDKLGDEDAAVACYEKTLAFDPTNAEAQTSLITLLEKGNRWRDLVGALEHQLKTVPEHESDRRVGILMRLGELRADKLQRSSEGAVAFEAVLEHNPGNEVALDRLEGLYRGLGRKRELLRVLERKLERHSSAPLCREIAKLRDEAGDLDGAISAFRNAFVAEPSDRDTFTAFEALCYKAERWSDAIALYNQTIEQVEAGSLRAYRLGDLYSRRGQVEFQYIGDLDASARSFLRVIELEPADDSAITALEGIYTRQRKWSELIDAHERRASLVKDQKIQLESLRRAVTVARTKAKDDERVERACRRILDIEPGDRESLTILDNYYSRAERWTELVDILETQLQAEATSGDKSMALLERVATIAEEGLRDEGKAVGYYKQILGVSENNKKALDALSRIYESTEQWMEFVDVTKRLCKVTSDRNAKALLYFKCGSVMEAKFGKQEDAIRYYDAAIKTSPACLPAVHGLRDLYRRRKDWPRVIQTLELEVKLWQEEKERAGVFAQIGGVYADELGEPERAMHYFESALAVDPECVPANKALFEHFFQQSQWERALPLAQALAQKAMRDGDPTSRSEFYRKRGIVARWTGDFAAAAESIIVALEIKPTNIDALESLTELADASPWAYDFSATFRELERIYRKRSDSARLLARVMVAQGLEKKRDGDLGAAEDLLAGATEKAPGDFRVAIALVDLYSSMRRWGKAVEVIGTFISRNDVSTEVQVSALLRQVEIHSDGEMSAEKAFSVLERVAALKPDDPDIQYRLAQELCCLRRFEEARAAVERAIELVAAPGREMSPERLARYYYYLGHIIEKSGDSRSAASQYRRAAEYDPGYAPPALALTKRAVDAGDIDGAETLLINAAHAAMEHGDEHSAVPLQRGLARLLVRRGNRSNAIEAYRGILAVEPDQVADRLALAEIYAEDDLRKAITEVGRVVETELRYPLAYRMLAGFYSRAGSFERAARMHDVMEVLGFAEADDRAMAASLRSRIAPSPLRNPLAAELRKSCLLTEEARSPIGELFVVASKELSMLFPQPPLGENVAALQTSDDPTFATAVADMMRLFTVELEIYVADRVPGGAVALSHPRGVVVIERTLLSEYDSARRYLLGMLFDAVKAGYATLLSLGHRQRREIGMLIRSLFEPESERSGPTNEFVKTLPDAAVDILSRHEGRYRGVDHEDWIDGMIATARRAGLVACNDLAAAARMTARLAGEVADPESMGGALGTAICGEDLFRYYIGNDYHQVREQLTRPPAPNSA